MVIVVFRGWDRFCVKWGERVMSKAPVPDAGYASAGG
jgi:hypothetical protein